MGGNRVQVFRAASLLWMWCVIFFRDIFIRRFVLELFLKLCFSLIFWRDRIVRNWYIFIDWIVVKTNFYLILQCLSYFLFKLDCLIFFFLRNYNYCKLFLPFFMLITILKMHKIKKGRVKNYRCFWIASQFFLLIEPRDELIKRNEWIRVLFGAENCAAVTCYGSLNLFLLQTPE